MTRIALTVLAYPGKVDRHAAVMLAENACACIASGWGVCVNTVCTQPTDVARNVAVDEALAAECTHLLMADADTWSDPGTAPVRVLMDELGDATAIGAAYVLRNRGELSVSEWKQDATYPCDRVSAGLMLINLERLRELGAGPWFRFEANGTGTKIEVSEDIYFCGRVLSRGGVMLATTKLKTRHNQTAALAVEQYTVKA